MKILVIDDNPIHQQSALQTLGSICDLTIVGTHDEAIEEVDGSTWDAVLCDLLMPAGKSKMGMKGKKFVGQKMPIGWSLALKAALRGAKFVAVVSDMDHHDHPASAMLDGMGMMEVNGARALFTNHPKKVVVDGLSAITCPYCSGSGRDPEVPKCKCYLCKGNGMYQQEGKDWANILRQLQDK